MAGQSNMVGENYDDEPNHNPACCLGWPSRILAFNNATGFVDARSCVGMRAWGWDVSFVCGPDLAFARTILLSGAASTVALVPTALGGTSLARDW